jgi:hypothetical protein
MWVVVSVFGAQADHSVASGDNKVELAQCLEKRQRDLAVERAVISVVPQAAEEAMENLKSYIVFPAPKEYHNEHVTIQDPWGEPC